MYRNRIHRLIDKDRSVSALHEPARDSMSAAFVMIPVGFIAFPWQQQLYQAAYEAACRDLLSSTQRFPEFSLN